MRLRNRRRRPSCSSVIMGARSGAARTKTESSRHRADRMPELIASDVPPCRCTTSGRATRRQLSGDRSAVVRDTPPRCLEAQSRSPSSRACRRSWRLAPDGARNPEPLAQAVRACFWDDPSFPICAGLSSNGATPLPSYAFTTSARWALCAEYIVALRNMAKRRRLSESTTTHSRFSLGQPLRLTRTVYASRRPSGRASFLSSNARV